MSHFGFSSCVLAILLSKIERKILRIKRYNRLQRSNSFEGSPSSYESIALCGTQVRAADASSKDDG